MWGQDLDLAPAQSIMMTDITTIGMGRAFTMEHTTPIIRPIMLGGDSTTTEAPITGAIITIMAMATAIIMGADMAEAGTAAADIIEFI